MLSDFKRDGMDDIVVEVLMHLLTLGAFRHADLLVRDPEEDTSFNAPFGARCSMTGRLRRTSARAERPVLMHLLALGTF